MNLTSIKREIHEYIDKADSRFVKLVYGMIAAEREDIFKKFDENDIVTRADLSEDDITAGRTIHAKDLQIEFNNWKRKKKANLK